MTDLKPCPFCGTEVELDGGNIGCPSIDCFFVHTDDCFATEAEAIAAWNRRQPPPEVAELVEAVRGLLGCYVGLVESGDCGFWDPENEKPVIAAREALAAYDNLKPKDSE